MPAGQDGSIADAADLAVAAAASKATYSGAGLTGLGWLFSNEFAVLAGILIGLAGLLVNWHYKRQANGRYRAEHEMRRREHEARMARFRAGMPAVLDGDTDSLELDE